jgi:hypothetical protein
MKVVKPPKSSGRQIPFMINPLADKVRAGVNPKVSILAVD